MTYTKHHRKPKSLGGEKTHRNISLLPERLHAAWHELFLNYTPEQIAREINCHYIDPDYVVLVRRKDAWTSEGSVSRMR